jgi:hypothetical protein
LRRLKQVGAGAALLAVAMLTALVLWVLFFRLPRF